VELLHRKKSHEMNGTQMLYQRILLEPQLVVRESCGYGKLRVQGSI
jgi:hypothetical protein